MSYETNSFGEVVNHPETFNKIATALLTNGVVVLNWTDEAGTLLNVLLSYDPVRWGSPGGFVDSGNHKLWIGVAGRGLFGFGYGSHSYDYVAEKLGLRPDLTASKLVELIDGVQRQLLVEMRS
jgi:hypothetical protein